MQQADARLLRQKYAGLAHAAPMWTSVLEVRTFILPLALSLLLAMLRASCCSMCASDVLPLATLELLCVLAHRAAPSMQFDGVRNLASSDAKHSTCVFRFILQPAACMSFSVALRESLRTTCIVQDGTKTLCDLDGFRLLRQARNTASDEDRGNLSWETIEVCQHQHSCPRCMISHVCARHRTCLRALSRQRLLSTTFPL